MDSVPVPGKDLPAIGGEIAGKYRVESVLGQGGMGAVFAARNMVTGKRVAIKWLLPQLASTASRERLMREARIAGEIEHPNVVDVYDMGEHDGGLFLVMEFLRGRSLADVLAVRGRLSPEELIPLLVPAMRGVHAAHLRGIVHRDLKPENIFLSEIDGVIIPKVLDFGVSKSIDALSEAPSPLTRTGALVGTPHYMALEQVDGSGTIDQRTDVYGFGVLLYRALTGYFPFDGSSLGEVILKIGTTQPTAPRLLRPELSEELEAVITRALARDRNTRFPDLESFALALIPFVPPTYVTLDGSPRYSISGDPRTASLGSIPPASGSRSVRSIVRDAPFPLTHSGLSLHGTQAPARYPTRTLWAAALSVLLAIASIAAWALTRRAEPAVSPLDPAFGALPPSLPSPPEQAPARGSVLGQSAPPALGSVAPRSAPAVEARPSQPAPDGAALAPAADAVVAGPGTAEPDPHLAEPAEEPGVEPERVPSGPRKAKANGVKASKGSRVIPGDRTKGLSSDEF